MKKKSQAELIEILLKNIINMHEKLNIINEKLALEIIKSLSLLINNTKRKMQK